MAARQRATCPTWPVASGGVSGLGTSPEWRSASGVVGQTCFHMPFPREHRPEDLPWVLLPRSVGLPPPKLLPWEILQQGGCQHLSLG